MKEERTTKTSPARSKPAGFARDVLAWIDEQPVLKLLVLVWIVVSTTWSFVADRVLAPRREAAKEQHEAALKGLGSDPKIFVIHLPDCRVINRDVRPVRQVTLTRFVYRVDLGRQCALQDFFGGGIRGRAVVLEPGAELAEDHNIGPPLQQAVREAFSPNECSHDGNCVVVSECAAQYHRDADLAAYKRSHWALAEQRDSWPLANRGSFLHRGPTGERAWIDERHERIFTCVGEMVKRRLEMLRYLDEELDEADAQ
jgi:hypothetical protein